MRLNRHFTLSLIWGLGILISTLSIGVQASDDHRPMLGTYGDDYATTPNLDAMATRGLQYNNAWSNAPFAHLPGQHSSPACIPHR